MRNEGWAGALALAFLLGGCGTDRAGEGTAFRAEPEENAVDTMILRPAVFYKQLVGNGKVRSARKGVLAFSRSGTVTELNVENGSAVGEGDVVARIDDRQARLDLQQARQKYDRSVIDLEDALIGFGYSLRDSASVPPEIMRVSRIRSGYEAAHVDLREAEMALEGCTLKAPFPGRVADLGARMYEQAGGPFCTLLDDGTFEVDFSVLESEIGFVRRGQEVEVAPFNDPERRRRGSVVRINPLVDANGQVRVTARLSGSAPFLLDGMNVKVFVEDGVPDRLVVPKTAVVMRDGYEVLFKYDASGKARWTYVKVVLTNSDSYAVVPDREKEAELAAGDAVIVSGNQNLADGAAVSVKP